MIDTWKRGVALALGLVVGSSAAAQSDPSAIAAARDTLAKWVETQQILSKERRDWQTGKDVLTQRIQLVKGEIQATEAKIAETRASMGESDRKRWETVERNNALKESTASLGASIAEVEAKTRRLVATFPEPLRSKIAPLTGRIPAPGASTQASLAERWQNVIGILNEANKFQRDVVVASEIRELPGGRRAEVQTVYLGLAQAFYVTASGDAAGIGRPGTDGWTWTAANELAPEVSRVLAILRNQSVPAFVPVPVEIR